VLAASSHTPLLIICLWLSWPNPTRVWYLGTYLPTYTHHPLTISCQHANMPTCQHANMPTCQHANMPTCQPANLPGRIDRYSALWKGHILSVHTSSERIRRHPSIHRHIRSLIRLLQSPPVLVGSVNAEPRTYLQNALPLGARQLRPTLILPRYLQMVMTEPCRQTDIHPWERRVEGTREPGEGASQFGPANLQTCVHTAYLDEKDRGRRKLFA